MDRTALSLLSLALSSLALSTGALVTGALVALATPARAADIFVPGDHATIQAAIEASANGDVIHVAAGTWPGALDTTHHAVTIAGAGAELTVIDGLGAAEVLHVGLGAFTVEIRDLTLTGGVTGTITLPKGAAGPLFRRCTFRNLTGDGATNIRALDCSFLDNGGHGAVESWIGNCDFIGNGGWGLVNLDGTSQNIGDCLFKGNGLGGLRLVASYPTLPPFGESASNWVEDCIFVDNTLQLSAYAPGAVGGNFVVHCSFSNSSIKVMNGTLIANLLIQRSAVPIINLAGTAAYVNNSNVLGGYAGTNIIDADPLWADPAHDDFSLQPGSPCINAGPSYPTLDPDGSDIPDMGAVSYATWTKLGDEVAQLSGWGPLEPDANLSLNLAGAPVTPHSGTIVWLVVGFSEAAAPFKGGTLWPAPDLLAGPFLTSPTGTLALAGSWPAGLPTGFTFTTQLWWADAGAPQGWSSSNGLRGVQP